MKEFWQRWKGLLPAVLLAAGVVICLAVTQPELPEVPELQLPELTAAAQTAQESAAASEEEPAEPELEELACADGVYLGTAQGYGGEIEVRVTVDGGEFLAIDIVSAEGETPRFFKRARRIVTEMMEQNTAEVDLISGATLSARGIRTAVQNAMNGVKNTKKTVTPQGDLSVADGRYIGAAQGFGGEVRVRVTVQSGRIIAVDLLEAEGETENFLTRARAVMTDIVTANSWQVDGVSGATYSSRGILNAVHNALTGEAEPAEVETSTEPAEVQPDELASVSSEAASPSEAAASEPDATSAEQRTGLVTWLIEQAKRVLPSAGASESTAEAEAASSAAQTPEESGEAVSAPESAVQPSSEAAAAPAYPDGTYTGTAVCTRTGRFDYDIAVRFEVKGGVIGVITVTKGADRSEEPSENDAFLTAAAARVPAQIVEQQSTDNIDAVSGATYSSKSILAAVQNALAAGPQEGNAS